MGTSAIAALRERKFDTSVEDEAIVNLLQSYSKLSSTQLQEKYACANVVPIVLAKSLISGKCSSWTMKVGG